MMNVLVIGITLTVLLTVTMYSSSDHRHVVAVKDGHRAVVVEYDYAADGTTKVFISPPVVPSAVNTKESSSDQKPSFQKKQSEGMVSGPDVICDAYNNCKRKIVDAFDKAHGIEKRTKEYVNEVIAEKVTKKGIIGKVKEVVKDCASKDFDIIDSPKRIGEDISRNVTGTVRETAEGVKKKVKKMGETSLNDIVYKLKEFVYDFTRYVYDHIYREKIGLSVVGLIHILGFSTAYGMGLWVTFVSSLILGRCLSRQMFGVVQSRMFTVYYKAMTYCVSAALFGHLAGLKSTVLSDRTGLFQSACLASSLLMVLMNLMWLEPESTRVMYERMKNEKEEGKGVGVVVSTNDGIADGASSVDGGGGGAATVVRSAPSVVVESQDVLRLNEKLKRLNLYTSTLNMLTLMVLTWHLVYLGQRLQE